MELAGVGLRRRLRRGVRARLGAIDIPAEGWQEQEQEQKQVQVQRQRQEQRPIQGSLRYALRASVEMTELGAAQGCALQSR